MHIHEEGHPHPYVNDAKLLNVEIVLQLILKFCYTTQPHQLLTNVIINAFPMLYITFSAK